MTFHKNIISKPHCRLKSYGREVGLIRTALLTAMLPALFVTSAIMYCKFLPFISCTLNETNIKISTEIYSWKKITQFFVAQKSPLLLVQQIDYWHRPFSEVSIMLLGLFLDPMLYLESSTLAVAALLFEVDLEPLDLNVLLERSEIQSSDSVAKTYSYLK